MNIPPSYPAKPPEVVFSTKVYHPLVDINTGRLDISVNYFYYFQKKFPTWEAGKNFIVKVIYFIHEIFHNTNIIEELETSKKNPIPFDQEQFEKDVSKISKKAFEERYDAKNKNSSLKFSKFNKFHQLILDKILKQNKEINTYDRIEDFKNWFMNNFMEIIQSGEMQNQTNQNINK